MNIFRKGITYLALCIALLVSTAEAAGTGYIDVPPNAWYADAADYCLENGLMVGSGGRFEPDAGLTRAQLVQILYNLAGQPATNWGVPFADTPQDAWYRPAVSWAVEQGVSSGSGGGNFAPENTATREQFAVMLWRYAGQPETGRPSSFSDEKTISSYARQAVDWVSAEGLMAGLPDGGFHPQAVITRSQTAVVVARYNAGQGSRLFTVSAMDVMCAPSGIAAMDDGTILVTDLYHKLLWRVQESSDEIYAGGETIAGIYGEPVGGYHDGQILSSYFKQPWAIAKFDGGWAVSDTGNNAIRIVRRREVNTFGGTTQENLTVTELGVAFDRPTGLASDSEGNLYVSDTGSGTVRKIDPQGVVSIAARGLNEPMGLCWKDGVLYIAETGANRIMKLEHGRLSHVAGSGSDGFADGPANQAEFSGPQGVTAGENGEIYVSDTLNSAIRKITGGQVETIVLRDMALAESGLISPKGLLLQRDRLYICDSFARKVFILEL